MITEPVSLSRRRLLSLLACSPLLATPSLQAASPDLQRIIALEWRPVEILLALGVMPLAIADLPNYRRWVVEPAPGPSVQDVGLRSEPSLELLQRLQPSLILLSSGFGPQAARIAPLAPQWVSQFSRAERGPLATTVDDIRSLGARLGLATAAERYLQTMEQQFSSSAIRLQRFRDQRLLMFSFLDSRRVMMFGAGSLFADVLHRLGLTSAWPGKTNAWGSAIVGIEQLAQVKDVRALCFLHGADDPMRELAGSQLWRSIPFVREKRLHLLPAVWFFGANFAALRFCQLLQQTLEGQE